MARRSVGLFLAAALAATFPERVQAGDPLILYLNSYHPGYAWSDHLYEGVRAGLDGRFGAEYDLRVEYLDGKRHHGALRGGLGESLEAYLALKYRDSVPALIMVTDQDAYDFLARVRGRLFPETPIVFSGVEYPYPLPPHTTGLLASTDYAGNLSLTLQVLPGTRRVWVITDRSTTGLLNRDLFAAAAKSFEDSVDIRYVDGENRGLWPEEMVEVLSALGSGDVVFFLDYYADPNGALVDVQELLRSLAAASPVPIVSHVELYLGTGVTGGLMNSANAQGRQLAALGVRILEGVQPDGIDPIRERAIPMFDWNAMTRFSISERLLPSDSVIMDRPESFLRRFGLTIAIIAAQTMLLAWLAWLLGKQRLLRRAAEDEIGRAHV